MKNEKLTFEKVKNFLDNLNELDKINTLNSYFDYCGDFDNYIYYVDDFDYLYKNKTPLELAKVLQNGSFNTNDKFFNYDSCGELQSFNSINDIYNEYSDYLAECILDFENLGNNLIIDFLKQYEAEQCI